MGTQEGCSHWCCEESAAGVASPAPRPGGCGQTSFRDHLARGLSWGSATAEVAPGRTPYREAEHRAAVGRLWGLETLGLSLHPGHKTRHQKCPSGNQHMEKRSRSRQQRDASRAGKQPEQEMSDSVESWPSSTEDFQGSPDWEGS